MTDKVKALAKVQAEQLIDGAIDKLLALNEFESDNRDDWLDQWWPAVNQNAAFWSAVYLRSGLATGVALEIVNRRWPSELPVEITTQYGDEDFKLWALGVTGLAESTVDNLLRIARTFVLDWAALPAEYKPEGPILIPERDSGGGEVVDVDPDTGEALLVLKPVEFNPWEIDHSKLIVARSRIRKGTATAALWEALADPKVSFNKTHRIAVGLGDTEPPGYGDTKLFWVGGLLMAKVNGVEVPIFTVGDIAYALYLGRTGTPAEQAITQDTLNKALEAIGAPKP